MSELRKSGIDVLGEIPWGSHFCTFYETKQDLLDTIVPFFKAGLDSNEYCLWVISNSELISLEEALELMIQAIPDFDRHSSEGNFEILNGHDWYLEDDVFHSGRALSELSAKLKRALSLGYEGMRASGDLSWLVEKYWKDFSNYEKQLNSSILDLRIMVLCTYPLVKSGAAEVLDVVQTHQFAIARRKGEWEVIETAMLIKAQAEIKRLNKELEATKIKTRKPFGIFNYLVTVLSVAAALIIARWLDINMVTAPVSLFLCAIMFSAWYGGLKPGLLAVALSVLAFKFYFISPLYSFNVDVNSLPRYLIFVVAMFFVVILSAAQRNVTESLKRARNILEETVQKLTQTNAVLHKEIIVRKQAEDTLRKSEDHLRLVIDTIPALVWCALPDGSVDFINQRHKEFTGLSLEDVQGWRWLNVIHPDDRLRVSEEWRTALATGKEVKTETRLRRASGDYRWLLIQATPLRNESGEIVRWYGTKTDITERKQAEEALRQSEDSIRLIIDTIPVMTWTLGADGKVDFLNKRWLDYTGISIEDEIKDPLGIVHPEDRIRVREKWNATLVTGNPSETEMRLRRADGEYRWFLLRSAPLHNESGNVVKWYGVCIDIEDKKRAEDELRLAYQRLSYHVENTPLAVIEWDKNLFIKRWSTHAEEIFGWKASEALGKNMHDPDFPIIYKEDLDAVNKIGEELVKGIVDRNLSLNRNYTKDGNIIYCEWYNSVLRDEHGNVITILSLVHNVTERKKAEETQNQSYEEIRRLTEHLQNIREEERTHIAREIHDELGSQLTVLKMDVSWLKKKLNDAGEAVKQKIRDLIDLLDATVKSVRRISSELRPNLLDNLGLIAAMEWHLSEFEKRSGIKSIFNEPEEELKIPDPIKNCLFRIFQESLTNVAKHSGAKEVKVDLLQKKDELILRIKDNGKGFDKQKAAEMKTLGILGMKERAIMMNGSYEIDSLPGKGTSVTVVLPCKNEKPNSSI